MRIGGSSTSPCELIVRHRSTGSPPAPTSSSSRCQVIPSYFRSQSDTVNATPGVAPKTTTVVPASRATALRRRRGVRDEHERARGRLDLLSVDVEHRMASQ